MRAFLRHRLLDPVLLLLKQGLTPEKLAWSWLWARRSASSR